MIPSLIPLERKYTDYFENGTGERIVNLTDRAGAEKLLPGAEILVSFPRIPEGYLDMAKNLKWIYIMSAGVNGLPFAELIRRNISVTNASGIHAEQMSEHAMGVMIMFSRRLDLNYRMQLRKKWLRVEDADELTGKSLCVVGAGTIGRELARKAGAFGMNVTGLKRNPSPVPFFDEILGMDRLHDALAKADYVVLLTPLTRETYRLFGEQEFASMKKSAVFLNLSRGDTVDETALIAALRGGTIRGAGLDVFHNEPLEPESPFWNLDNVILTPHNSGLSRHYFQRAVELFAQSYRCFRNGLELPNRVDLVKQY